VLALGDFFTQSNGVFGNLFNVGVFVQIVLRVRNLNRVNVFLLRIAEEFSFVEQHVVLVADVCDVEQGQ